MRKQSKWIVAAGILAFASCNTGTPGAGNNDEATIDSMVNARVEELRLEMMMQNDSIINVLAQERADSILAAMNNKKTVRRTPKKKVISRDKGTMSAGGNSAQMGDTKPVDNTPKNTGKMGNQQTGTNTGKKGAQNTGTNTGKKN